MESLKMMIKPIEKSRFPLNLHSLFSQIFDKNPKKVIGTVTKNHLKMDHFSKKFHPDIWREN